MAEVDITIIGAGPTGLLSALLARQNGFSVCILDKRAGPLEVGRADALNARTQQILDVVGVLPELRPKGLLCNTSSIFKGGSFISRNNKWWVDLKNTHYKEFLMIGQSDIEKAILKHLDIDVRYSTVVDTITESAEGVLTNVGNEIIRSKYAIGADGAHSRTRQQLSIDFSGQKPNMCWAVLDTFLETNFPVCNEIINFEENGQSRVAWIPRERGMARFYILLEGEVSQERSEAAIRSHMAPYSVKFKQTEWFSAYDVQERVADTFVSRDHGRIILAGDAAHIHAVNGGQGLNTGVSDAFALSWRLALAIRGFDKSVLESYNDERRTTAKNVVDVASKLVRSTLRTATEYVRLVERNAANITGMGIMYDPSSAAVRSGSVGAFVAGGRCPDFNLLKASTVPIRLYELLKVGKFTVLNSTKLCLDLSRSLHEWVEVWDCSAKSDGCEVVTAANARLTTSFDLGGVELVAIVIRPDLYVGYVGRDVSEYFEGFLSLSA